MRPIARLPVWVFALRSLKSSGQDFLHHSVVVARLQALILDIEFAILVLAEALFGRDDHGAERRRAESDPGHASAAVEGDEGGLRGGTLREDRLRCAPAEPASPRFLICRIRHTLTTRSR